MPLLAPINTIYFVVYVIGPINRWSWLFFFVFSFILFILILSILCFVVYAWSCYSSCWCDLQIFIIWKVGFWHILSDWRNIWPYQKHINLKILWLFHVLVYSCVKFKSWMSKIVVAFWTRWSCSGVNYNYPNYVIITFLSSSINCAVILLCFFFLLFFILCYIYLTIVSLDSTLWILWYFYLPEVLYLILIF